MALMAKKHNNANVLALGGRMIEFKTAKNIINIFLNTDFENSDRHFRRLDKIKFLESRDNLMFI